MWNGIPLSKPDLGLAEAQSVLEVMNSGQLAHGDKNKEFEQLFAQKIGVKHAVSMNSCASALQIALEVNNIRGGVIVPSFTFTASGNAILRAGASIEFAEINRNDCMIDPEKLVVTPNTEALMVVHYGGLCADMNPIIAFCEKHGLLLIEDSAECIGGTYHERMAGSFGIGCFSFFPTKNMTTGEGGMLTTNDEAIAEKARRIISHGTSRDKFPWNRVATEVGVNYRMSNIHAAIGVEQLKRLDEMNQTRRCKAIQYIKRLEPVLNRIFTPIGDRPNRKHVYQMFNILVSEGMPRNEIVFKLNEMGIGASVHFDPPMHRQPAFRQDIYLPETDWVSNHILSLPMFTRLSRHDIDGIVDGLLECLMY